MKHLFVEFIPAEIEEGVIYISMIYGTAIHKCACGCGNKVVTPFSPKDWQITYDGDSVTIYPSIGNWNFECRSHYWIKKNEVVWIPDSVEDKCLTINKKSRNLFIKLINAILKK